jgi:hypothetical protein
MGFIAGAEKVAEASWELQQVSLELREQTPNDTAFADSVRLVARSRLQPVLGYEYNPTILPPELAYLIGQGDCSEQSMIELRMLNEGGIDAHPVYGTVYGYGSKSLHMTVEYTNEDNNTAQRIDAKDFPTFWKYTEGKEYIYLTMFPGDYNLFALIADVWTRLLWEIGNNH